MNIRLDLCSLILASVWVLTSSGTTLAAGPSVIEQVHVKPGKTFTISLPENQTTGYSWQIVAPGNAANIQKGAEGFIWPKQILTGTGGTHTWTFKAKKSGQTSIVFWMAKWWDPTEPITMHRVNVDIGTASSSKTSPPKTYTGSK